MEVILGIGLLAAAGLLVRQLIRERRLVKQIAESIEGRTLHLSEGVSGHWSRLNAAANQLIEENRRLAGENEAHLEQIQTVVDGLREVIVLTDASGRIVIANQPARALLSQAGDWSTVRLQRLLPNPEITTLVEEVCRGRAETPVEFNVAATSGTLRMTAIGRPVTGASTAGRRLFLFVLTDVTRERELEGMQRDLVGNVSHELRTPISVIQGYSETLAEEHERMPVEDRTRFIQAIHRHSLRLASLVEDLLTLSRLDSKYPGLEYEVLDVHAEIIRLSEDFLARARTRGHHMDLALAAEASIVRADAFRLSQVLENLIENALKYSGAGSTIRVVTRSEDGNFICGIQDNGPGIPEKDLPRIFERFYRVEKGRSRDKGGTGLGLTIVREIVELHGGRVWAESREGVGTCFWFSLPLLKQADQGPANQVP
jgi:two-component system phosphate regulon sensor histidine kinase PhoR